jgi:hypothetical protein
MPVRISDASRDPVQVLIPDFSQRRGILASLRFLKEMRSLMVINLPLQLLETLQLIIMFDSDIYVFCHLPGPRVLDSLKPRMDAILDTRSEINTVTPDIESHLSRF